jgi:hypothetical protein
MVEHRQPGGFEHHPSHLRVDVRTVGIPAPRTQDITEAQKLHAPAPEDVHLA